MYEITCNWKGTYIVVTKSNFNFRIRKHEGDACTSSPVTGLPRNLKKNTLDLHGFYTKSGRLLTDQLKKLATYYLEDLLIQKYSKIKPGF